MPFTIYRMKLADGVDASRIAAALQTVFLDNSMLAVDADLELRTSVAQNEQFSLLFQGFMGLGLVVGVAGTRRVVPCERSTNVGCRSRLCGRSDIERG